MKNFSRRGMMAGAAVCVAAIGGALTYFIHPFAKHYAPTPYDDLFARLIDREAGARLGAAVLKHAVRFDARDTAARLRAGLRGRSLAMLADEDARAGRLAETDGWVLPQSVTMLCALAAANS